MNENSLGYQLAVDFFTRVMCFSLPITIIFGYGNMLVSMFLTSVFGGRFRIGGKHS